MFQRDLYAFIFFYIPTFLLFAICPPPNLGGTMMTSLVSVTHLPSGLTAEHWMVIPVSSGSRLDRWSSQPNSVSLSGTEKKPQ